MQGWLTSRNITVGWYAPPMYPIACPKMWLPLINPHPVLWGPHGPRKDWIRHHTALPCSKGETNSAHEGGKLRPCLLGNGTKRENHCASYIGGHKYSNFGVQTWFDFTQVRQISKVIHFLRFNDISTYLIHGCHYHLIWYTCLFYERLVVITWSEFSRSHWLKKYDKYTKMIAFF